MALRFLRTRGASVAAIRPFVVSQQPVAIYGVRKYTTPTKDESKQVVEPQKKALSIIDSLPGNSLISKTGYVTIGTGLTTFAISKELFVFNEEFLLVVSFGALLTVLFRALRQPYNDWAQEQINRVNKILRQAREDHKVAVKDRIDTVGQMGDIVDVTKALFAMSKETATLEAEAFELKQRVAAVAEIKSVLDSWVRYEVSLREQEQKSLAGQVIERVKASLQDPRVQQQILAQSVVDFEQIIGSKSA